MFRRCRAIHDGCRPPPHGTDLLVTTAGLSVDPAKSPARDGWDAGGAPPTSLRCPGTARGHARWGPIRTVQYGGRRVPSTSRPPASISCSQAAGRGGNHPRALAKLEMTFCLECKACTFPSVRRRLIRYQTSGTAWVYLQKKPSNGVKTTAQANRGADRAKAQTANNPPPSLAGNQRRGFFGTGRALLLPKSQIRRAQESRRGPRHVLSRRLGRSEGRKTSGSPS